MIVIPRTATARRANTGNGHYQWVRLSRIYGGFIKSMATCGIGRKIAGTTTISTRHQMVQRGKVRIALFTLFAVVRGAMIHGSFAQLTAAEVLRFRQVAI